MSNPLPGLRGTSQQALYTFSRITSCSTTINQFFNGSEQRFVNRIPYYNFILPMNTLNATDKASWLALHNAAKGQFEQNLELTLGSTTYSNLALMSDDIVQTNNRPLLYDQEIHLRQTIPASAGGPPTVGTSFPTFSWGGVAQMPLTQVSSFLTNVNEQASGPRYAFAYYAGGLSNFPSTYLRSWRISYSILSDADLATLETFFLGMQGRYGSFSFTDPLDSTTYNHVRFDQDDLQITYQTKNINSVEVTLRETFNS